MSVAAHLGIDLAQYDERIRTFIAGYDEMLAIVALTLRTATRSRAPLIVDLGIGTGALSAACLRQVPGARIAGIDADEGMIALARRRLGRRLVDAVHDSFERAAIPRCDAAIASLALHHIPTPARRLRLFRRLRAALRPGGVVISLDAHPPVHPRLAALRRKIWFAHMERTYTTAQARAFLRAWAREDHYVAIADELALLRRAGFVPDVAWRRDGYAIIVATR